MDTNAKYDISRVILLATAHMEVALTATQAGDGSTAYEQLTAAKELIETAKRKLNEAMG